MIYLESTNLNRHIYTKNNPPILDVKEPLS
jgi:hypothetical protein